MIKRILSGVNFFRKGGEMSSGVAWEKGTSPMEECDDGDGSQI